MKRFVCIISILLVCCINVACGHEHDWKAATCTEAMMCTGCGAVQGEPLDHIYENATCEKPKVCLECGKELGEPIGHEFEKATCTQPQICIRCGKEQGERVAHSTEFGVCTSCKIYQGEEIVDKIEKIIEDKKEKGEELIYYISDYLEASNYTTRSYIEISDIVKLQFKDMIPFYEEVIELCGNYPELDDLKQSVSSLIEVLQLREYPKTRSGAQLFFDDLESYVYAMATVQLKLIVVKDQIMTINEESEKVEESNKTNHVRDIEILSYYNSVMDPLNEDITKTDDELEQMSQRVIEDIEEKYGLSFEEIMAIIGDAELQKEFYSNQ